MAIRILYFVHSTTTDNALEVITKGISWDEANKNDWRKTGDWQPGWEYIIEE